MRLCASYDALGNEVWTRQFGNSNDMFWDCGHTKKQYIL